MVVPVTAPEPSSSVALYPASGSWVRCLPHAVRPEDVQLCGNLVDFPALLYSAALPSTAWNSLACLRQRWTSVHLHDLTSRVAGDPAVIDKSSADTSLRPEKKNGHADTFAVGEEQKTEGKLFLLRIFMVRNQEQCRTCDDCTPNAALTHREIAGAPLDHRTRICTCLSAG
jgi:hypothetical protein